MAMGKEKKKEEEEEYGEGGVKGREKIGVDPWNSLDGRVKEDAVTRPGDLRTRTRVHPPT